MAKFKTYLTTPYAARQIATALGSTHSAGQVCLLGVAPSKKALGDLMCEQGHMHPYGLRGFLRQTTLNASQTTLKLLVDSGVIDTSEPAVYALRLDGFGKVLRLCAGGSFEHVATITTNPPTFVGRLVELP